ncbi:sterol desaturase family protein [Chengkuizengella axinellae]|uniref:Sterol desaturase family protein n=1 Tax=Chengkuizengella axinellae TaxID=3064388 RepID=A0ABT9IV92_9BACL|nr:sterol desaturase family protein [Chengkuizengella sp. 2205SS18-9]MDP5273280.1 sterol desaturase family protein [Chengkuizengella sp. 2205SS18-9]
MKYIKEFFSVRDIQITSIVFLILLTITLFDYSNGTLWLAMLIGIVGYAITEYLIHRFLFHMKPPRKNVLLKIMKRMHYLHHVHPNDVKLLFLPVWYSFPLFITAGLIVFLITFEIMISISFTTGVLAYLLYYEWSHYVAHRPIQPITPWGKFMKKTHLLHHYKNEHFWFGVTHPTFDLMFNTYRNEKKVEKSDTVRDLEKKQLNS